LREPPGGPRSGGEAMSEAKPVRWRPCEAGARPNFSEFSYAPPKITIFYSETIWKFRGG
jgi:hypothetical protein